MTSSIRFVQKGPEFMLECRQMIDLPRDELFPFFSDPRNLQLITPPWLNFRIASTLPEQISSGTVIDYRLKVRGLPLFWKTVIEEWDPPNGFVDIQTRGPYRKWRHEHVFADRGDRTECVDRVHYQLYGGVIGRALVHPLFVRSDVEKIFRFRMKWLEDLFSVGPKAAAC